MKIILYILTVVIIYLPITMVVQIFIAHLFGSVLGRFFGTKFTYFIGAVIFWSIVNLVWKYFTKQHIPLLLLISLWQYSIWFYKKYKYQMDFPAKLSRGTEKYAFFVLTLYILIFESSKVWI